MADYDARGELAPRDVVSQAIESQMERTRHACVYLDMSHLDPEFTRRRFPGIAAMCAKFGLDLTRDRIPVRPGAHYMIGGVIVDHDGRTSVPGLWAAGEVTSTGLHGANRLASNSLLEGLVYGARAGHGASAAAADSNTLALACPLENPPKVEPDEPLDLADIRNSLKSLLWRTAGVRRERAALADAVETVDAWSRYVFARQFDNSDGWELQNMLTVARVLLRAALAREESRGVHLRTDFPQTDDRRWLGHLVYQRRADGRLGDPEFQRRA
jgi:L-aspartate oxidase